MVLGSLVMIQAISIRLAETKLRWSFSSSADTGLLGRASLISACTIH